MDTLLLSLLLISMLKLGCCDFPFRNISLPINERVADLVNRLSLPELVIQMSRGGGGGDGGPVPAIDRLAIGKYWWGTECNHGVLNGKTTIFPAPLGMAAAFSPELIYRVATALSIEARALNNDFVKRGIYSTHTGLHCFSPVVNIMRHPLWGRNQETYGEDPYLSGVYGELFSAGMKGDHSKYYRANAVCKHFDAYGGPEDLPESRLSFNARVPERDLHVTYLPQFKACLRGGALGVMCSYNSVNGVPACANKMLLTDILRTAWNFTGFVISDSGAVEFLVLNHKYIQNLEDAAVSCVRAGLNLELHAQQYPSGAFDWLIYAVQEKKISKELLVERVKPLFYTRMMLGEFDPPHLNPFLTLNLSVVQSHAHRDLATLAAIQSFVLLKNDGLLPLKKVIGNIAIVGPFADNAEQQMGNYSPDIDPRYTSTVKTGLYPLGSNITLAAGCTRPQCLDYDAKSLREAVKEAQLTFVCLGTGPAIENENFDRQDMMLPGYQAQLLRDVIDNTQGQVVLLVFSTGPLDIRVAMKPAVAAIIHCFFPAQSTGEALYRVVTNKRPGSNPAGRLPFTWYLSDNQVPDMEVYRMWNQTYRYYTGDPMFPFGYGLSYTKFQYSNLKLSPTTVQPRQNVTATFTLSNVGPLAGDEVIQVYISWLNATVPTPRYQLVNFTRVSIGQSKTISLTVSITSMSVAVYVEGKGFVVEPGNIAVYVGGQLPNQKTKVPSNVLKAVFTIV